MGYGQNENKNLEPQKNVHLQECPNMLPKELQTP